MSKKELQDLVDMLSDCECEHLLGIVRNAVEGDRFWESDMGVFYNEHVKMRSFHVIHDLARLIPSSPSPTVVADEGIFSPIPIVKPYPNAMKVSLPSPRDLETNITAVLAHRRSRRNYNGKSISLSQLSTLLQHGAGVTGFMKGYGYDHLPLRTFPSSGGLQSPELYLSVHAVDDLPAGIYHYQPLGHFLEQIKLDNYAQTISDLSLGQDFIRNSAIVFMLTAYYERVRWKYGDRSYRYACMDCGFLAENLYLVGEALGLGVCAIAGFSDGPIEKLLDINGRDEVILLLVSIGAMGQD